MPLIVIAVVILLVLAVASVYEISIIYKARALTDKAKMVESHSRALESSELFGYILAGILMYMSELDIIVVAVVIVVGLYHLMGVLPTKEMMLQFSQEKLKRMLTFVMAVCFVEIVVAVSVVAWIASNGLISL